MIDPKSDPYSPTDINIVDVYDRTRLEGHDPWGWDDAAFQTLRNENVKDAYNLAHFYSGSFPETARLLSDRGVKISWTIAAHDRTVSRREHEALGLEFPYSHL